MKIIAVANHKGGVGKSSTTHALGASLAERGHRVLMIDSDPQSSLTGSCGVTGAEGRSMAEVLGDTMPGKLALTAVLQELGPNLTLAPADIALATTELGLVSRMGRENALKRILEDVGAIFDICLVDCPPSLGVLTVNALVAAQGALVPTQPQVVDLRGLRLFLDTLDRIREVLNPDLETVGVLVTFYDSRLVHHREAVEVMESGNLPLLSTKIGRSVRVAEAAAVGEAVTTYAPKNPQAENYKNLAEEVEQWLNERK